MNYTINKLSMLSGLSVRALHHYDQIGLLKPAFIAKNGYRQYGEKELLRLQQILFFRELDFSLEEIRKILDNPGLDKFDILHSQKRMLAIKRERLGRLIKSIDKTIKSMGSKQQQNPEEMYDPFKDEDVKEYQDEVKTRWGNTDAYKQSMERVKKMTKEEMNKMKEDGKKFTQTLADSMDKGIEHPDVQALIAIHREGINIFYECSLDMYRNLGQMYVDDPRFTAYYDKFRPGLAAFMRDAIAFYCDNR